MALVPRLFVCMPDRDLKAIKFTLMPYKTKYLDEIVSYELNKSTMEMFAESIDRLDSVKTALSRCILHVKSNSNLSNRYAIREAIINQIVEKPRPVNNIGFQELAKGILEWKRPNKTAIDLRNELRYEITPFPVKAWRYLTGYYDIKHYIIKNSEYFTLFILGFWGMIHLTFYMNDTYSIIYNGKVYLQNVSMQVYNDYVYKLPGNYGDRLIGGTLKKYFSIFPEWSMLVIYWGYFVMLIICFRISEMHKKTY